MPIIASSMACLCLQADQPRRPTAVVVTTATRVTSRGRNGEGSSWTPRARVQLAKELQKQQRDDAPSSPHSCPHQRAQARGTTHTHIRPLESVALHSMQCSCGVCFQVDEAWIQSPLFALCHIAVHMPALPPLLWGIEAHSQASQPHTQSASAAPRSRDKCCVGHTAPRRRHPPPPPPCWPRASAAMSSPSCA